MVPQSDPLRLYCWIPMFSTTVQASLYRLPWFLMFYLQVFDQGSLYLVHVNWIISTVVSGPTVAWFQGGDVLLALEMVVEMNWGLHRAIKFRAAVFERLHCDAGNFFFEVNV